MCAVDDGGCWEWSGTGCVQPCEDENRYQRRRVPDRLTPRTLATYGGSLGIRPFDESFNESDGHLVESTRIHVSIPTETLAQARARHGLE